MFGQEVLISNEGDGKAPYDVYDLSGNLLLASFIAPPNDGYNCNNVGIAWDGSFFYTYTLSPTVLVPSLAK